MKAQANGALLLAAAATAAAWQPWNPDRPPATEESVERFLDQHWAHPIAPQGNPPAAFSPLEASLSAQACAQCHPDQHRDWSRSLHSRALGPH